MPYPINLTAEYPEKLSRGILILRTLLGVFYVGIPHGICLALYGVVVFFATIAAWFVVLFTGRYPKDLYDLVVGYKRWEARVRAYMLFLTDQYPPFNGTE
jgi:hypothetical protein